MSYHHVPRARQSRATTGWQRPRSPAALPQPESGTRIVLPSPNGSRLSLATGNIPPISGCLRNARAVAQEAAVVAGEGTIAVIAAGERWKDQSLVPLSKTGSERARSSRPCAGTRTPRPLAQRTLSQPRR